MLRAAYIACIESAASEDEAFAVALRTVYEAVMSERYIIVTEDQLWLVVQDVDPEYDDGLITIRDCSGGNALVGRDEIPALIEALKSLVEQKS